MNTKYILTTLFSCLDLLTVLERWVEQGEAPQSILTTKMDAEANVLWTRPICPYPQREVYAGQGDVNDASNFDCVDY
jgi:feruloyl esterase